jgi:hypothetical protein
MIKKSEKKKKNCKKKVKIKRKKWQKKKEMHCWLLRNALGVDEQWIPHTL